MPVLRTRRFLRVKLDMVGRCQLRCVMCHFAHPDFQENPITMGKELLEKVAADLFPIAHDVVLSSSAEPLLAPDLPRALELCREHEVPSFHFSTNAINLTAGIINKVIDVQMPLITISIDGGTKETFESIRKPMKWEKILSRFDRLSQIKKERGSRYPIVSATTVLMRRTIRGDAHAGARDGRARGRADELRAHGGHRRPWASRTSRSSTSPRSRTTSWRSARSCAMSSASEATLPLPFPENFGGSIDEYGEIRDAKRSDEGGGSAMGQAEDAEVPFDTFSVSEFMNHKNREFLLAVPEKATHNRRCYFPWFYIHVNPDGTVFPCGSWFEFSTFGDFRKQTFREIWTSEPYRRLRHEHVAMKHRDVCANCTVANMGRPDVEASFSHRAKIRREWRERAAREGAPGLPPSASASNQSGAGS